ncbi:MAG: nucleotidyl transferase AbiEii/AbiGii toxin family protein [Candidatus Cloacimonetes bacterium]|nr:nucleotidyl transferase AbiEii/AbiGii toxin family protein [Candidatus Cloacimonadota bacterium]MBS3768281.1 nucleotidyl transferase AbiEii/AbiGii toxin family protein [Candidatus Cloacimonadota bacterium]
MIRNITNLTASVRTRLLKIAQMKQRDFNAVLLQYFQERLLYRLSISPYRDKFVLKGALLFLVYDIPAARPTKDIDFLSREMDNKEQNLLNLIREIIKIQVRDGVRFDPQSLGVETIQENAAYNGIRIHCIAHLGKARRRFPIDIGFGDKVVPAPFEPFSNLFPWIYQ